MKTVFSNSEVAHVWAQQDQDEGRNSNNSFYFHNETIYSYGSHFPIASFWDYNTVFMTTQGYSNTTSRHIHYVWDAIRHKNVIRMHTVIFKTDSKQELKKKHEKNIKEMFNELSELAGKQKRARKWDYTNEISSVIDQLREYADIFNIMSFLTKAQKQVLENGYESFEQVEGVKKSMTKRDKLKATKQRKAREEAQRKRNEELKEEIELWKLGEKRYIPYDYRGDSLLRIIERADGVKLLETSQRVQLPIEEAESVFKFINKLKSSGKSWKRNGQTFQIGDHYQLDLLTADGDMVAGCHTIKWSEIERIANQMNWI